MDCFPFQDRANTLFKQVHEGKTLKGRSNDAISSACLYIACRQEGVPRTFKGKRSYTVIQFMLAVIKNTFVPYSHSILMSVNAEWLLFSEICAVSKISKKEIGRVFKLILKTLETSVELITTGDFMVKSNEN